MCICAIRFITVFVAPVKATVRRLIPFRCLYTGRLSSHSSLSLYSVSFVIYLFHSLLFSRQSTSEQSVYVVREARVSARTQICVCRPRGDRERFWMDLERSEICQGDGMGRYRFRKGGMLPGTMMERCISSIITPGRLRGSILGIGM